MTTLQSTGLWLAALVGALFFATSCKPREKSLSELKLVAGILTHQGEPFTGVLVEHYPGGAPQSRSEVKKGRLHGKSEGWFAAGNREVEEFFINGVSHGKRTRWHSNGQIASEAFIQNGEISGTFRRWHPNGHLAEEISMLGGKPHGLSRSFQADGSPLAEVVFKNNRVVSSQYWDAGDAPQPHR